MQKMEEYEVTREEKMSLVFKTTDVVTFPVFKRIVPIWLFCKRSSAISENLDLDFCEGRCEVLFMVEVADDELGKEDCYYQVV